MPVDGEIDGWFVTVLYDFVGSCGSVGLVHMYVDEVSQGFLSVKWGRDGGSGQVVSTVRDKINVCMYQQMNS